MSLPAHGHILLVGLMGSGKSAVARRVGEMRGCTVIDTDKMVELRTGRTVRDIFETDGEDVFRDIEHDVLVEALSNPEPLVIAGAGGVVLRADNRAVIADARSKGSLQVVWLTASVGTLVERTSRGSHRPLIDQDPRFRLTEMMKTRGALYAEVADAQVSTENAEVEQVAERVVSAISSDGGW